jgi:subtilase family serine protease
LDCSWNKFCSSGSCVTIEEEFVACANDFGCGTDLSKCCASMSFEVLTITLYQTDSYCIDSEIVSYLNTITTAATDDLTAGLGSISVDCATKYREMVIILAVIIVAIIIIVVICKCVRNRRNKRLQS